MSAAVVVKKWFLSLIHNKWTDQFCNNQAHAAETAFCKLKFTDRQIFRVTCMYIYVHVCMQFGAQMKSSFVCSFSLVDQGYLH